MSARIGLIEDRFGVLRYAKRIIEDGKGRIPTEIAPGTKVYELVEELAKYLPEEIQDKFMKI